MMAATATTRAVMEAAVMEAAVMELAVREAAVTGGDDGGEAVTATVMGSAQPSLILRLHVRRLRGRLQPRTVSRRRPADAWRSLLLVSVVLREHSMKQ